MLHLMFGYLIYFIRHIFFAISSISSSDATKSFFGSIFFCEFRQTKLEERKKMASGTGVPKGKQNCLDGLTFVVTGKFESMEREEVKPYIVDLGGRVTGAISGKTDYIVAGTDAGPAKLAKANEMGIQILTEKQFYDFVRDKSGGRKH